MLLIWGFRTKPLLLARLMLACRACGNPAAHTLTYYRRWFTLFFLPVFPVGGKRVLTCTFCGHQTLVTAEDAKAMVASVAQPAAGPGPAVEQIPGPEPRPEQRSA